MNKGFVDFHSHSLDSDGVYLRKELVKKAYEAGIRIFSVTDHNYIEDISYLAYKDMKIINGVEISTRFIDSDGVSREIHIVGLGIDINNEKLKRVIEVNQLDRSIYINMILEKLKLFDMYVGTYEELLEINNGKDNFGRSLIAKQMVKKGYCKDVEEAFDEYIGGFGKKKAYVVNPLQYADIKDVIEAIIDASGIPVLAHLNYYGMNDKNNRYLLSEFKKYAKDKATMEVYYGAYTHEQRLQLKCLADEYGYMYSCGSDYHGHRKDDILEHGFKQNDVCALLEALGV